MGKIKEKDDEIEKLNKKILVNEHRIADLENQINRNANDSAVSQMSGGGVEKSVKSFHVANENFYALLNQH